MCVFLNSASIPFWPVHSHIIMNPTSVPWPDTTVGLEALRGWNCNGCGWHIAPSRRNLYVTSKMNPQLFVRGSFFSTLNVNENWWLFLFFWLQRLEQGFNEAFQSQLKCHWATNYMAAHSTDICVCVYCVFACSLPTDALTGLMKYFQKITTLSLKRRFR